MKKEYIVQVKSLKESLKDFAVAYKRLRSGKKIKPVEKLTFVNVDVFRKFMTNRRIELLKIIKNQNPTSIKELSRLTKRDYKSINIDLEILKKVDLVSMKKNNNKVVPKVDYKEIDIKIPLETWYYSFAYS